MINFNVLDTFSKAITELLSSFASVLSSHLEQACNLFLPHISRMAALTKRSALATKPLLEGHMSLY